MTNMPATKKDTGARVNRKRAGVVKDRKPSRPYTDYNIFFQLEREHVLQVSLGVEPSIAYGVFDPSNDNDYQGPPLPSRYNGLILPGDWYVPGKVVRRKRVHRKSHGVIGFRELSNRIAVSWKSVDEETKEFCEKLSDIGVLQYKAAVRKYKIANPEEICEAPKISKRNLNPTPKRSTKALNPSLPAQDTCNNNGISNNFLGEIDDPNRELFLSIMTDSNFGESDFRDEVDSRYSSLSSLLCATESIDDSTPVDMEDTEILGIWDSLCAPEIVSKTSRQLPNDMIPDGGSSFCTLIPKSFTDGGPSFCTLLSRSDSSQDEAYMSESLFCQPIG